MRLKRNTDEPPTSQLQGRSRAPCFRIRNALHNTNAKSQLTVQARTKNSTKSKRVEKKLSSMMTAKENNRKTNQSNSAHRKQTEVALPNRAACRRLVA